MDVAAYQEQVDDSKFDMIFSISPVSNSPGNELRDWYKSSSASAKGTRNQWGIQDPVVDRLVEEVITAKNFDDLKLKMRALDRVLINGYYMIPTWYTNKVDVAYWNVLDHPKTPPKYMPITLETWWSKGEKPQQEVEYKTTETKTSDQPKDSKGKDQTNRTLWDMIKGWFTNTLKAWFK